MQINSVSNFSFGKNGYLGKAGGRVNRKPKHTPLNNKSERLVEKFERDISRTYNSLRQDKEAVQEELSSLKTSFLDRFDNIEDKNYMRDYKKRKF